ncbi:hypothetical protein HK097_008274 [Rhizophlyctis rosea]|uniref:K Homology domain-containing protein n=1 Tax=Rhizophlyctis rosea TaxID=64517 RepID=A0AAD5X154_9FUNG|nr:hypothetical protein HK097_008274 [Rhizophlyctis rosea]
MTSGSSPSPNSANTPASDSADGSAPPAKQVDYSNALERAKAIAARLTAETKALADKGKGVCSRSVYTPGKLIIITIETTQGTKRSHASLSPPPFQSSTSYRREDDDRDYKKQATDSAWGGESGGGRARPGLGAPGAPASIGGGGSHYGPGGGGGGGRFTLEMDIPSGMVGLVIGRGGENMKKVERTCNVKVQFAPADPSNPIRVTTISGAEADCRDAQDMIQGMLNSPGGPGGRMGGGPGGNMSSMQVPGHKVGLVIGRGGETIHSLQDRSGAKIAVTPETDEDRNTQMRTITMTGTPQAVDTARDLIHELVNSQPQGRGGPGGGFGPTETMLVHHERVGLIIGRGGETIKAIQHQCGVKINIDPTTLPDGNRNVTISGPQDAIERAKELIWEKVQPRQGGSFSGGGGGGRGGGDWGNQGYGGGQQGYGQGGYDQQQQQQWGYGGQQQDVGANVPWGYAGEGGHQQQQQQQGYDAQGYGDQAQAYGGAEQGQGYGDPNAGYDQAAYQKAWEEYYKQYGDAAYAGYGTADQSGPGGAVGGKGVPGVPGGDAGTAPPGSS